MKTETNEPTTQAKGVHPLAAMFFTAGTVITCLITSIVAIPNARDIVRDVSSYRWAYVQGVVLNKESRSSINHKGASNIIDVISYEYVAGYRKYTGEITYSRPLPGPKNSFGNDFEPGDVIDVYYDPSLPDQSKYKTGVGIDSLLMHFVLTGFASFLLYTTVMLWSEVTWKENAGGTNWNESGWRLRPYRNIGIITLLISIIMMGL